VVTRYHGAGTAKAELAAFRRTFTDRAQPAEIPTVTVTHERPTVLDVLRAIEPSASNSSLRRLVRQGAVAIDGRRHDDPAAPVDLTAPTVVRSGPRAWHRVIAGPPSRQKCPVEA
ncbi:MAG TPA: hypothetical protein VFH76_20455, partial [Kribbella sp.]|nr:hypothetical protein [Kribbella sp.]